MEFKRNMSMLRVFVFISLFCGLQVIESLTKETSSSQILNPTYDSSTDEASTSTSSANVAVVKSITDETSSSQILNPSTHTSSAGKATTSTSPANATFIESLTEETSSSQILNPTYNSSTDEASTSTSSANVAVAELELVGEGLSSSEILNLMQAWSIDEATTSTTTANVTENEPIDDVIIIMEDVSEYSSSFLSGLTSIPSVKFKDGRTYSLEVKEPGFDDKIMNRVRQEIKETPERMNSAKVELRALIKKDKNLNAPSENDAWLIRFLRARSYKVEEAYKTIKRYYRFKHRNKFIFKNLVPSDEMEVFEKEVIIPLPKRDQKGRRVIVVRASMWDQKKYPVDRMCRMIVLFKELGSYEPATLLAGVQIIFDLKDATRDQAVTIAFKIAVVKKMLYWTLACVPLKIIGFHVVNQPTWFWPMFQFFQSLGLLPQTLISRLSVHGTNWSSLHQHIKDIYLPFEYGGHFPFPRISSSEWEVLLKFGDKEYEKIKLYGIKKKNPWMNWITGRRSSSRHQSLSGEETLAIHRNRPRMRSSPA